VLAFAKRFGEARPECRTSACRHARRTGREFAIIIIHLVLAKTWLISLHRDFVQNRKIVLEMKIL
jgi:hypothetical protein